MTALDDVRLLRDDQGRSPESIDWDRVRTIAYRSLAAPEGLIIDAGAGDALQSRRLRRYLRPTQVFLVESDNKEASKLRFQWARKRGITVVQVALGAEASTGEDGDVDRLDDWTLPSPLVFLRVAVGDGWRAVLDGAAEVIGRDRPVIGLEADADPAALTDGATAYDLAILDLLGNVMTTDELAEVVAYQPAVLLVPAEKLDGLDHTRTILRNDVLRSIENYRPFRERLKRLIGV